MNDLTTNINIPAKNDLKKSIKAVFYILCTFPVIAVFAVIPTYVYVIFSSILGLPISESSEYIFTFAVPQILYPVFTLIAAFFMIGFSGKTKQQLIKFNDPPAVDVLLALGIFLGMGTVGTYLSDFITKIHQVEVLRYGAESKVYIRQCLSPAQGFRNKRAQTYTLSALLYNQR